MNYMKILEASCIDFKGWSVVLHLSGCSHGCDGCFNIRAQDPRAGIPFTDETYDELYKLLDKPYISNLVIQGGEITHKRNIEYGITLCRCIKREFPNKNIVIFTGYTLLELQSDSILSKVIPCVNYIVDGRYDRSLSKNPPLYRGSSNQKIYHIVDGKPILDKNLN